MQKEILISFKELRDISNRIVEIVCETGGFDRDKVTLSTSINGDLGIDGDDWGEVFWTLQTRENLNLDGLNFYDYFSEEGQISSAML